MDDLSSEESQIHETIHSEQVQSAMRTIERLNLLNLTAVAKAQDLTEEETQTWIEEYQRWYQDMLLLSLSSGINMDDGVLCEIWKRKDEM